MILLEGGNIWDDVETNFDPVNIGKPLAGTTQRFLNPLKTKLNVIGSCYKPRYDINGNVIPSNDLDSMVELNDLMQTFGTKDAKSTRKALNDYFQKQKIETKQTGVTVHTRIPLNDKFYQVDIKVIPNAAKVAQFHRHEIPKGSPYKGVNKQLIMNALATSQGMLWSPDEGLYNRDANGKKGELLSDDWDKIAQYLLGKGSTGTDLGSVESIMAKIPDPKRKEEILNMARSGHSWIEPTKESTEVLVQEDNPDRVSELQTAFNQAVQVTKQIKYDTTVNDIITQIQLLAEKYKIDSNELKYPVEEVLQAQNNLESAIYGLDEIFKDAWKDAKWRLEDEDSGEIEEGYRAGAVGGAGLDIEKSPIEKIIEKPLGEEKKSDVGRKYQHIEDLVLSRGSHGGLHAVERLRDMATTGGTLELKWDGMPVVYWGRDDQGNFMMIPKNAWAYLKGGKTQTKSGASTATKNAKEVYNFIMGTGSVDHGGREKFARQFASLWPYFEKISPKQGFIEGGLLFYPGTKFDGENAMPVLNKETNTYDFQPNITQFHITADSDLGKKIAKAKVGVAATGYYPTLGSSDEQRYPDAQKLSTPDVLVQGTTFVQEPVKINTKMLDNVEKFIQSHASKIDKYLEPKPGLSRPANEIYTYLNQHGRTIGLANDFADWAKANLSPKKAETMLGDRQGMIATLGAIEAITKQKTALFRQLSQQTHGGIRQTKPEGYAQAHPGRKFQYDIPGQFIKAVDQTTWSPRASAVREAIEDNKAVLGWGRGMGHTGHDALVTAVIHQAENTGATPFFIVSRSFGKDDPIPPDMKLQMYQKKFPKYKNIFSLPIEDKPSLNDVLADLASKGYKDVTLVVGADQKEAFGYLLKPAKSTGVEPYKSFGLDNLNIMSRQDTKAPGSDPESKDYHEGPRATPMRQALLDPNMTDEEKFKVWRQSMSPSLSDKEVMDMMNIAKDNLVKFNMPKPKAKKLKEFLEKIKPLLPSISKEQKQRLIGLLEAATIPQKVSEAANPAQQAAIAISIKKAGKKPKKKVDETVDYLPEK